MNNDLIDIIAINEKIKKKLEKKKDKIPKLKKSLKILKDAIKLSGITENTRKDIQNDIDYYINELYNLENNIEYSFYITQTENIIEKYKNVIKKPKIVSFTGKTIPIENKEKNDIINQFFDIAKDYIDIKIDKKKSSKISNSCESCNSINFDIIDNEYICIECGTVIEKEMENSSYSDVDRINITVKYNYDRIPNFRDIIYQYQAKQNIVIKPEVYDDIIAECKKIKGLLVGNENTNKNIRYRKITKENIINFLKHLNYSEYYAHVHLIHWKLTGKPPNNISHLEDILLDDFSILVKAYFIKKKNGTLKTTRKSFPNKQHIFYQLLLRHHFDCDKNDFSLLKNIDRISQHDSICEELFESQGWSYYSLY